MTRCPSGAARAIPAWGPLLLLLVSACAGEIENRLGACVNGMVSSACTCGGSLVSGGYCCDGLAQTDQCTSLSSYCGDGACLELETWGNCPSDCPAPADCSDGAVTQTCLCGAAAVTSGYCCSRSPSSSACAETEDVCGDGVCGDSEDAASCASDCDAGDACGDGVCDASEDAASCPSDCDAGDACGDGVCDASEDASSCPADCQEDPDPPAGALIIDHRAVAMFDNIPPEYLAAAKELTLHYAHTSHGSQLVSGAYWLEDNVDATAYSIAINESGSEGLPGEESPAALRVYDGNPPDTYITPELYWASDDGRSRTRAVANSGNYDLSMWSWCGQQSYNDTSTVNAYLATMSGFEDEYPGMRFILMTGHLDGSNTPGTPGTLKYNNQLIRDYAQANEMVLFDFADIESYDPDGNYYEWGSDACEWCDDWCATHPSECASVPDCAHSHGFNCIQKSKAFWVMMARLAGWSGI